MPYNLEICQSCGFGYAAVHAPTIINGAQVPLCRTCIEKYREHLVQKARRTGQDPVAKRVGEMKKTWDRMAIDEKHAVMIEAERRKEMAKRAREGRRWDRGYFEKEKEKEVDRLVRD